jgi:uncharacterized OsmC-like protein
VLSYDVTLVSASTDATLVAVDDVEVVVDTSAEGRPDAPNAAELLLMAVATCMSKGVRRAAASNRFEVGRVEIRVHGERQDRPPKMQRIAYEILVEVEGPDHRLDLLHRNVLKFGTVTNTVAPGVELSGTLRRWPAAPALVGRKPSA